MYVSIFSCIRRIALTLVFFGALIMHTPAQAQSYKVYDRFESFQPLLNQHNDTTYVINFWATWCAPCVKELPYFNKIHQEYQGKPVKVILVSLDFGRRVQERLNAFLTRKDISAPVILLDDPNSSEWIDKVDPGWSGAIPATIIYRGADKSFYEQEFTYNQLKQEVAQKTSTK